MSIIKENIGAQFTLPVLDVITIKGRKSYIVQYGECRCRVPLFEWQYDIEAPKELRCRLKSINDFGFPVFEQIAQQEEIKVVESANESSNKSASSDRVASYWERYGKHRHQQNTKETTSPIDENTSENRECLDDADRCEHDITFYKWSEQEANFDEWLISTGGIRIRYEILIALAKIIAQYHRENKVYKNMTPQYVGVIVNRDNSVSIQMPETSHLTSGYGNLFVYASHSAPEIVNRRIPNTPMSDCFTFSILAHEILTFCHPFIGDVVKNDLNLMEDAFKGKLPWIDNSNDKSNTLTLRHYDFLFTTPEIRDLFKRTFEEGLNNLMLRPTIFEWIDALEDGRDHIKQCSNCHADYLYFEDGACAICDEEPQFDIRIDIARLEKKYNFDTHTFSDSETELYPEIITTFYVNKDNNAIVNTKHILAETNKEQEVLSVALKKDNKEKTIKEVEDERQISVIIKPLNGYSFYVATADGQLFSHKLFEEKEINDRRTLVLALEETNKPQRVILINKSYKKNERN